MKEKNHQEEHMSINPKILYSTNKETDHVRKNLLNSTLNKYHQMASMRR
ncbi:hypothetical protein PAECIP111894_00793 [Paenibacillus pseudetheri]|uniref:Uncharacterized protein n=1 Tax=Paenibacillus pseudetheri TaxID=2897682 RepID=A0ABN8FHF2_9BACL|nr:hypothetical protein PAECIP111894_00793 [Paenibacillus pseudetheri]